MNYANLTRIGLLALVCLFATACGDRTTDTRSNAAVEAVSPSSVIAESGAPSSPRKAASANQTPIISGSAPGQATVGQPWGFQPNISDPDGNGLSVSASNLPSWLSIDNRTGRLRGTPTEADVQEWNGIVLSVTDGSLSASLPAFSINVMPPNAATGSATLSWLPPTEKVDGSPVGELGGYRLLYGQTSGTYSNTVEINNPGITRYMIEGLTSGVWYFAIQAVDGAGRASEPSAEARKNI